MGDQGTGTVIRPVRSMITAALFYWEAKLIKYRANSFAFKWYKIPLFCTVTKPILQKAQTLKRETEVLDLQGQVYIWCEFSGKGLMCGK